MLMAMAAAMAAFQTAPCRLEGAAADFERTNRVECGWISVPLRSGEAQSQRIRLWAARIRATGKQVAPDPIIYINGGPGIATVDSILPYIATNKTFTALRAQRDIILFDQRGSGRSEQALCPDLGKSLNAVSDEGLSPADESARGRALFSQCRASLEAAGIDIGAYTTKAIAGDVEAIRTALAIPRWNIISVSYGSLVAMHLMRTASGAIRSVILNSPYPPNSVSWAEQASVAAGAYGAIDRACAARPNCRAKLGPVLPKLEETLARLDKQPIKDGERTITGRLFAEALWPLAVQSGTVSFVPLAVARAHSGDAEVIKGLVRTFAGGGAFGGYSPAQGMAITCHELGRTSGWYRRARDLYPSLVSAAPDDSWDRLCADYRPGFADPNFFAPVASDIPTLLYAGTLDAATPVVDAYQATRFLTKATLIEVEGASHAPMGKDDCTRGIATQFLDRPEVTPNVDCVAARPPLEFAEEGLEGLLQPAQP